MINISPMARVSSKAKKAGRKIKEDAKDLSHQTQAAVQPDTESASDKMSHAALLAKVKTKLASDAGLSTLAHVDVTLNGSVVTLSGTVANEDQKKRAEIAASQVDGVTRVRNRLVAQP